MSARNGEQRNYGGFLKVSFCKWQANENPAVQYVFIHLLSIIEFLLWMAFEQRKINEPIQKYPTKTVQIKKQFDQFEIWNLKYWKWNYRNIWNLKYVPVHL